MPKVKKSVSATRRVPGGWGGFNRTTPIRRAINCAEIKRAADVFFNAKTTRIPLVHSLMDAPAFTSKNKNIP